MGMGMIHVGAGRVVNLEFIDVAATGRHVVHGVAIHDLRNMQPMPVDNVGLGQVIFEIKTNLLASFQEEHRA